MIELVLEKDHSAYSVENELESGKSRNETQLRGVVFDLNKDSDYLNQAKYWKVRLEKWTCQKNNLRSRTVPGYSV